MFFGKMKKTVKHEQKKKMECQICYAHSYSEKCVCYCGFKTCEQCLQTWITSHTDKEPSCPNCSRVFSQDYIYTTFDRSFLTGGYAIWRQEFLMSREKMFFVNDYEMVRNEQIRRRMRAELLRLYKKKKSYLRKRADTSDIVCEINTLKEKIPRKTHEITQTTERTTYLFPCPHPKCRGCIQKSNASCSLCENKVCRSCFVLLINKDELHECKEDDVNNARHILQDTRACPRCAVRIHKISGCDQMWCVMCHCTFSYETGRESTSIVHNPHYFDWFFSRDRENGENERNECEDYVGYVQRFLLKDDFRKRREYYQLTSFFRLILHIDHVVIPEFQTNHRTNESLRFRYLLNEITENDLKRLLYKRETRGLKRLAVLQLYTCFITIAKNILSDYLNETLDFIGFSDVFLKTYDETVRCAGVIVSSYGGKVKHLDELDRYHFWHEKFRVLTPRP